MHGEFASGETLAILERKLLPVLEELARAEFTPICFDGDVDAECAECMRNSIEIVVGAINVYLRGLMELYTGYGQYVTEISLRSQSQPEPTPETQSQEPS